MRTLTIAHFLFANNVAFFFLASSVRDSLPQSLEKIKKRISTLKTVNVQGGKIWFFKRKTSSSLQVIRIWNRRPWRSKKQAIHFGLQWSLRKPQWICTPTLNDGHGTLALKEEIMDTSRLKRGSLRGFLGWASEVRQENDKSLWL